MDKTKNKKCKNLLVKTANPILTKQDLKNFACRSFSVKKFNSGVVRFSRLYSLNKTWMKYLVAAIVGLIMSIATVLLVEVTGLYTGGFGAFLQGVARLTYSGISNSVLKDNPYIAQIIFNAMFWGLYLLLNIPLSIFAFRKISHQFVGLSLTYLIVLQGMGFVWGIIPHIHDLQIFGNTQTVNEHLANFNIQSIIFSPNWFPTEINGSWDWSQLKSSTDPGVDHNIVSTVTNENITRAFLLIVYCIVFSLISGLSYAIMFSIGGSTAGSDYLTIYWSQEKNKNVGGVFAIISSVSMFLGICMGTYGAGGIIDSSKYLGWQYFFSANLFASLVWVFLNGWLIDKWFPWHKLVRVEVYSNKVNEINDELKTIKYTHPTTLLSATGGYSNKPTKMLLSVCMIVELPELIKQIRKVDDQCLISSSYIADIDGRMSVQKQTN
ncbi:MAG: DUF2179 domain-containing protein [Mycoplasmataceae bacterium]|nr:DUF2179 domain-containing protein [Mycoplasmataceae bacterium]